MAASAYDFDAWVVGEHEPPDDAPSPVADGWVIILNHDTGRYFVVDPETFDAEYEFL